MFAIGKNKLDRAALNSFIEANRDEFAAALDNVLGDLVASGATVYVHEGRDVYRYNRKAATYGKRNSRKIKTLRSHRI